MADTHRWLKNSNIGIFILSAFMLAYGFSLGRYPSFYTDEAFFAYPALNAYLGRGLTYPVSQNAPFANSLWAYHGPLLPHLDLALFKLFGFNELVSRLPNFVGGWLAPIVMWFF